MQRISKKVLTKVTVLHNECDKGNGWRVWGDSEWRAGEWENEFSLEHPEFEMPKGYLSKEVPFGAQWQRGKLNPSLSVNKATFLHIISHIILLSKH